MWHGVLWCGGRPGRLREILGRLFLVVWRGEAGCGVIGFGRAGCGTLGLGRAGSGEAR